MKQPLHNRLNQTSNTWTVSSSEVLSEREDAYDRLEFVEEFNQLARKVMTAEKPNWFKRKILRRTSSLQSIKGDKTVKQRRSISDLSGRFRSKKDVLKDKDLQDLVRLCGLSLLYLPTEYAPRSLELPTCLRATAQYLIQHGIATRGIFRIPGSYSSVNALYNHYCTLDEEGDAIAGTVRCPTLPAHIKCDVYDVASAFKKFLSGLPNGLLGSLSVFCSLVSVHDQLQGGEPEMNKTKQTKIRARLIALTLLSLKSDYRRDLICAVFGLLSMIGRAAEIAPREDDRGRPLPTSDLMGYAPLGIVFGPLLLGDLLDNFTVRVGNPHGPLVITPVSSPKTRKERQPRSHMHKKSASSLINEAKAFNSQIDKVKVANDITEMLITHWRDVVRHMKTLQPSKSIKGTGHLCKNLLPETDGTLELPEAWSAILHVNFSLH
ncbi:Rho GTPase activation protein [Calycina marina]|uniref:Rho GTPase activation protein n=1 Tax=Calycina marina TaxID=1763456 RepID=A0A9P7Z6A4_9HELO|nr:Rho GTPase activation protein [Calycina marina]